jgi:hypothetical protein
MTLEDSDDGITLTAFDSSFNPARTERLALHRTAKLRVGGTGG